MKAWIAIVCMLVGVAIGAGITGTPPADAPATPCTKMHRQLIVMPRVNADGDLVSTPIVVDVCDKANVAYVESK